MNDPDLQHQLEFFQWAASRIPNAGKPRHCSSTILNDTFDYYAVKLGPIELIFHTAASLTGRGIYLFYESSILGSTLHNLTLEERLAKLRLDHPGIRMDLRACAILAILLSYQIPSPSPA